MQRAQELADELDISMRTFYRRLKDGEIEGVDTVAGRRYQLADTARPAPEEASFIRRSPSPPIVNITENERLTARVRELEAEVESLNRRLQALLDWSELTEQRLAKRRR